MAAPMQPEQLKHHLSVLNESRNREELASSARALAASQDPAALLELARRLRRADFLDRLDDTSDPVSDIDHLSQVFAELRTHPVEASGKVCVATYDSPEFRALPIRVNMLLAALASVVPVSPDAARVFRESSAEGYAEVNGPLLIANESPLALQVFEELIGGTWVDAYVKVDILHRAVIPKRTSRPVLEVCARLLASGVEPEVRDGILETLFDYRQKEWYGPVLQAPTPPPWESASTEALTFLLQLAGRVHHDNMDDRLKAAVQATGDRIREILAGRHR